MSRLTNTIRNTVVGFAAQLIVILLNYINRTIFIYYLGAEYLGLSGLFLIFFQCFLWPSWELVLRYRLVYISLLRKMILEKQRR